jgi:hypothetical protein
MENFRAGVINFHEILQQICENLDGWSKKFPKMTFFWQNFPIFGPKFFLGGYRLRIFQVVGFRLSTPHPPPTPPPWNHDLDGAFFFLSFFLSL